MKTSILNKELIEYMKNRSFLITGGAGSIGSVLARFLRDIRVARVVLFDTNESELVRLKRILGGNVEIFLGDIRDAQSVKEALQDIDIVFHAAALKHVPLSEYYPFEYVKTNILGTQNVIERSLEAGVEKFMFISTDKAVNPTNVMGATKLLGERITLAANLARRNRRTRFSCVRFGNVLYTRGSVIELWLEQVKQGYITVTNPEMTRFIMSVNMAVELILKATYYARGGEIFVLKMKSVRIGDLARAFVEVVAPAMGLDPRRVEIKIVGERPGEKMHEELMTDIESLRVVEFDDMYVIYSDLQAPPDVQKIGVARLGKYSSKDYVINNVDVIKEMLMEFLGSVEVAKRYNLDLSRITPSGGGVNG